MFCTACESTTSDLSHYKTQFHINNVRRKFLGYPPLTIEEYDSESVTEDLSINLNLKELPIENKIMEVLKTPEKYQACMFCACENTPFHHREHGLTDEQMVYLKNLQCYVCYEKFFEIELLMKHIDNNEHKSIFTDGNSLYLENGKILNKNTTQMPVRLEIAEPAYKPVFKEENKQEIKVKEMREKEKLVVSMVNNRQFGKFLH